MTTYNSRRANTHDIPFIVDCRRRMFAEMGETAYLEAKDMDLRYRAWIAPRLADERHIGWIIEAQGQAVAVAGLELLENQPHPATQSNLRGHIVNVYVEAAHRRQGLVRQLMTTLLDWCAQQQIGLITLNASEAGRPLYEALGFERSSEMIYQRRMRA
jgi:ribosomal protein S18 acetylase RimI-like enzyme